MTAWDSPLSIRFIMLALRDLASTTAEDLVATAEEEDETLLTEDDSMVDL